MTPSSSRQLGQPPVGVGLAGLAQQHRQLVGQGQVGGLGEQVLRQGQHHLVDRQQGGALPAAAPAGGTAASEARSPRAARRQLQVCQPVAARGRATGNLPPGCSLRSSSAACSTAASAGGSSRSSAAPDLVGRRQLARRARDRPGSAAGCPARRPTGGWRWCCAAGRRHTAGRGGAARRPARSRARCAAPARPRSNRGARAASAPASRPPPGSPPAG